jgi:hypothetical protein
MAARKEASAGGCCEWCALKDNGARRGRGMARFEGFEGARSLDDDD